MGEQGNKQARQKQAEEESEWDDGHGVDMSGVSVGERPLGSGAGRMVFYLMTDQFLRSEPEVEIAAGRPAFFQPEKIGAFLDFLFGRLQGVCAWLGGSFHGVVDWNHLSAPARIPLCTDWPLSRIFCGGCKMCAALRKCCRVISAAVW